MIEPAMLQRIPGASRGPVRVRQLAGGGGANELLDISTAEGRFVLRRRRNPVSRPGAAPQHELVAHRTAAAAGLAPRLLAWADDGAWLLMEHVAGDPWNGDWVDSPSHIEILGRRLQALHALPVQPPAAFDARHIAASQLQQAARNSMPGLEMAAGLQREVEQDAARLAGFAVPAVLNHGDLQGSNVLGPDAVLVDWEYAQWVDPIWDIACLLTYYPRLAASLDRLLGAAGLDSRHARERLAVAQPLFRHLDALWRIANSLPGTHEHKPA